MKCQNYALFIRVKTTAELHTCVYRIVICILISTASYIQTHADKPLTALNYSKYKTLVKATSYATSPSYCTGHNGRSYS